MSSNGRPSKLTLERSTQICRLIRLGNTVTVAAAAAGIGRSTFYLWTRRDAGFRDAVTRARAEAEVALATQVGVARDWRAAAWQLERRFPERWAAPPSGR